MSFALSKAAPLKAEIRLAQAVSQFEADLSSDQKADFRSQKSKTCKNPPSAQDVMYLTAKIDRETSRKTGGDGRCFGPRFTNMLQAVQQFAALGDVIIGGSQNIIACGVWSLVRMTLLSLVNYSSYMEKLSALLMVAGRSAPRYQKMALLYPRSRISQSSLYEYFIVVVQLCHHMLKTTKRTVIGQLGSSLSDQELGDYENALLRWATAIKEEADLLINERIDDQGVRVKMLLKLSESEAYRQKFKIHCQVLDRCSVYDYETTWKETRKAGNATLLSSIPEYASWKNHMGPSTLLLRGKLGAGKSVLLANAVDDLNLHVSTSQTQTPVAYFFCRHDILESLKARTVIGSLARQLLRSGPLLTTPDVIDETLPNMDCERILSTLHKILPSSFKAYFVLDGLDECGPKERVTILGHVRTLQRRVRLLACLSFRVDASDTQWWLPSMVIDPHMVTIPDENPDIARFISSELENIIESGILKVGDPAIVLEIEDALLQGSQGMFLWVSLQIESLCSAKTDDSIREALANLPKDLPETFIRIIQSSGKAGKDYQMRVFELVLAACRPLAIEELQEALSVRPGNTNWNSTQFLNDIYSALACCGSLISINEEGLTVKVIHHSVKQFLLGQSLSSHAGLFTLDRANRTLGEIIITYLNYDVFSGTVSTTVIPEIRPEASPWKIVKSMGTIAPVQTLALKYLKSRRQQLGYSMGKTLVDATRNGQLHGKILFHFHSYAKSHWQDHIMFVPASEEAIMSLTAKLIISYPALDYIGNAPNGEQHLLFWAVELGHEEIVRALLDMGVNTEVRNRLGWTPLWSAVDHGHESIVRYLIKKGADLEAKDDAGMTPLFLAVKRPNDAIASILLSHGADPDVGSQDELLRLFPTRLLDNPSGSDRTKVIKGDQTTYITRGSAHGFAFGFTNEVMVLLLLRPSRSGSDWLDKVGFDPLEYSLKSSHIHIVKRVLGRDKNFLSYQVKLFLAIKNHDTAVVRALLESLPNFNKRIYLSSLDERDDGVLQVAIRECQPDIVCLLLDHRADPNYDKFGVTTGFTPLMNAVMLGNKQILEALIDHGADVNLRDHKNRTVLSWAAEGGDPEVIDFLVSCKGFEENQYDIPDTEFRTPLTYAILQNNLFAARRLLELGASPNINGCRTADTALFHAISKDFPAGVQLLLAHGADVGGMSGQVCLEKAIALGSLENVEHLISCGARTDWVWGWHGMTMEVTPASKFARDEGQPEIASYLEERGL